VILLDEVDKVGADWRGDPSAALLEVLDRPKPLVRDHYLDVEVDFSEVVFLATANMTTRSGAAAGPDGDHRLDGYTTAEKLAIARGYLLPRSLERNGWSEEVEIGEEIAGARRRCSAESSTSGRSTPLRARSRRPPLLQQLRSSRSSGTRRLVG